LRGAGAVVGFATLAMQGCGGENAPAPPPMTSSEACVAPNRIVGDPARCVEPGVQDDGCPAGTRGADDGTCRPAGVPPDLCAQGFLHDGDAGCNPILPPETCAKGLMAIPGESACRPVMPCGAGKWGDIPIDAGTVYVDAGYAGADSDGSVDRPWTAINDAVAAAPAGALIAVASGTYFEELVVEKAVRLWGVCPEQVEIAGASAPAVAFRPGSSGSRLRGVAVTGESLGVVVAGAQEVVIESVWVHDTLDRAFDIEESLGPTSATLRGCLVEQSRHGGVFLFGSDTTVEDTVVRSVLPASSDPFGRGFEVRATNAGVPSRVVVKNSVVEHCVGTGVHVAGAAATFEGLVVRHTQVPSGGYLTTGITVRPHAATGALTSALLRSSVLEGNHGVGVYVSASEATIEGVVIRDTKGGSVTSPGYALFLDAQADIPAQVLVTGSLVEGHQGAGVAVRGSDATLDRVVVRDSNPYAGADLFGGGISILPGVDTGMPSRVVVRGSVVERNHEVGIQATGSQATLEGVIVRDNQPRPGDSKFGSGVVFGRDAGGGSPSEGAVIASLIERNHEVGVLISGSEANVEGAVVRDTRARPSDGRYGRGITFQAAPGTSLASTGTLASSLIEGNHEFGVFVFAASVAISDVHVRDTAPGVSDGLYGDGIAVMSEDAQAIASATVTRVWLGQNSRAGLSSFAGTVVLGASVLSCNGYDINGEKLDGQQFRFEDAGDNACGCPKPASDCVVESAGLMAPDVISDEG
jgi:hypothetical protein